MKSAVGANDRRRQPHAPCDGSQSSTIFTPATRECHYEREGNPVDQYHRNPRPHTPQMPADACHCIAEHENSHWG